MIQTSPTKTVFDIANNHQQLGKKAQLALWQHFNNARELVVLGGYPFTQAGIKDYLYNIPVRTQQVEYRRIIMGGLKAKDALIFSFQALIINRATYYANDIIPFEEMAQIANLGAMVGLAKFKPTKNAKVSSYCAFWIKAKILDALNRINPIYVPPHIKKELEEYNYKFLSTSSKESTIDVSNEDTPKTTTLNEVMVNLTQQEQELLSDAFGLDGRTTMLTVALINGWSFEEAKKQVESVLARARTMEVAC